MDLKDMYDDYYKEQINKGKYLYSDFENNKKFIQNFIDMISGTDKILEIGCGTGYFVSYLRDIGFDAVGCDISKIAIEYAKKTFNDEWFFLQKDNSFLDKKGCYDVVMSFDVIEHIPNTKQHLNDVFRILKDEGLYFIGTPNKYFNLIHEIILNKNIYIHKYHPSLQTVKSLSTQLTVVKFSQIIVFQPESDDYIESKTNKITFFGPIFSSVLKIKIFKQFFRPTIYLVAKK